MKRLFTAVCILIIFMSVFPSGVCADESFEGRDWYMTKDHTFTMPLKEEFPDAQVQLRAKVGYIRECAGGVPKYYLDRMISYELSVISEDEDLYIEDGDATFNKNGYRELAVIYVSGVAAEAVPIKSGVIPPKSGILKNMNWTLSTKYYTRELFYGDFKIDVW